MNELIQIIIDNWALVIGLAAVVVAVGFWGVNFLGLPTNAQVAKIKEWLLFAVITAEADLGSGTGQLKLRFVYDMFVERFPTVAKVISFETFAKWVDEALVKMREMLAQNPAVAAIVVPTEPLNGEVVQ